MALPKIDVPIFEVKLFSTDKKVKFRPFTVKEEKLFLIASESDDPQSSIATIKQVLNNCILDDTDIDSLPLFDVEMLFLNLRARSIGEVVDLKYKCNNNIVEEDGREHKCGNEVGIEVNVLEVLPEVGQNHSKKIEINNKLGLVMKYPKMDIVVNMDDEGNIDSVLQMIVSCIDYIYDENNLYYAKDSTKEELVEFLETLQSKDLENIKQFFETMPKMKKTLDFKCGKCGYQEKIDVEGIQNFFG
jgi:hypothetical protein